MYHPALPRWWCAVQPAKKSPPPDFSIPMEDRQIGGLGIFLVVQNMDTVAYEHTGGENILTVMKKIKNK